MAQITCMCGHPEHKGIVHRENAACYSMPKPVEPPKEPTADTK